MKVKLRQEKIVDYVRRNSSASVEELAELLTISRETIRRDLNELSQHGRIQKIHGGATIPHRLGEGTFGQRMSENAEAKMAIARAAVKLFKRGETLFIDTGATTLFFAEQLADHTDMTIATNSIEVAKTICAAENNNQVFLLGGKFALGNQQTVGEMVISQIANFRAHHAVLTIGAIDTHTGAMDFNSEESQVAKAMLKQSQNLTVLVDSSKFNQLASFKVCSMKAITSLVCEAAPPADLAKELSAAGVKVVIAD